MTTITNKKSKNKNKNKNKNINMKINNDDNIPEEWRKEMENANVIDINGNDMSDIDEWRRTFEIDDIAKQELKAIPTRTWNPKTGTIENVSKYTKTQKRKHQINTLAYECQEKQLQYQMGKTAAFKTKAETQAKYGW